MDSNSLLTSLMQLAERSKRNLRAAPGQIADQVSNFIPDWKATSAAVPAVVKSGAGKTDEEVFKKAIEETAGNAIPGGAGAAGIFAGPQGIARLKAAGLGDKMKEFTSRFFGQRAEINPTDTDLVIQAMMGGPHAVAKAKALEFESWNTAQKELFKQAKAHPESVGLQEALARHKAAQPKQAVAADFLENFPELVIAYPRLKELPINFYDNSIGVRYAGKYDPDFAKSVKVPYGAGLEAEDAFYKAMGTKRFEAPAKIRLRGEEVNKMAKKRANIKAREDSYTGSIDVVGQANADIPGVHSYETILHEIQHFIQREEAGLGKVRGTHFLDLYADKEGKRLTNYDRLTDKITARKDVVERDAINMEEKAKKAYEAAMPRVEAAADQLAKRVDAGKLTEEKAADLLDSMYTIALRDSGADFYASHMQPLFYKKAQKVFKKLNSADTPMQQRNWDYNMNPFEREAYEASKRDVNPGYRNKYSRKTEVIK